MMAGADARSLYRLSRRVLPLLILLASSCSREHAPAESQMLELPRHTAIVKAEISCRQEDGAFLNGRRDGDEIALSFDLCPTTHVPPFAAGLVAYLKSANVPATFFISGKWARANPEDLKSLAGDRLFELALHGDEHRHLPAGAPQTIREEIEGGRKTLVAMGARSVPLFRPPYGETPPELPEVSREENVVPVLWDVALADPLPYRTAALMERDGLRWVQGGSIIVLHANGRGVNTEETVREIVPALRKRGYVFVHVDELTRRCHVSPTVSAGGTAQGAPVQAGQTGFVGVWLWGSALASDGVPFLRISRSKERWQIETKNYMHAYFVRDAKDIRADGNHLEFAYFYEPLRRWARCKLDLNGDVMSGVCDGEIDAQHWGSQPSYLWRLTARTNQALAE